MFESPQAGVPRRAIRIMPFAFGGLALLSSRRSRAAPDARSGGSGPIVPLLIFSDRG